MDKVRQKQLQKWLKAQQKNIKPILYLNVILAAVSTVVLISQTWLLATVFQKLIIEQQSNQSLLSYFLVMIGLFAVRAGLLLWREKLGYRCGQQLRQQIRQQILTKLNQVGPASVAYRPVGSWATMVLEQVENLHNFYARYLPQQYLSVIAPFLIAIAVFPVNWAAGIILLGTAPLIPIFMALVGMKAAEANQKNVDVLARLSGQFLDRLQGLQNLRIFNRTAEQTEQLEERTEDFRATTMDVLKVAFLSSAVLEFFTSISIALTAVYFGFSYLGQFHFGSYSTTVTLFAGFFCLILAPEFYQPLRDLGTYYHDKAAAVGAADTIVTFLEQDFFIHSAKQADKNLVLANDGINLIATDLVILSPQGQALSKKLNFQLSAGQSVALVGQSGAGKTSLLNVLLGFLPYQGSLTVNGQELNQLDLVQWRQRIAWVGQNPLLLQGTIRENLLLANPNADDRTIQQALIEAYADEFTQKCGLDKPLQDGGIGISVGQAQRLAIARALLKTSTDFLLLDEPTASLDSRSEQLVLQSLQKLSESKTTLMITHRIEDLKQCDQIWVMRQGELVQQGSFQQLQTEGYFADLLSQRIADMG
ncbi:thiol reductant ABC exporter subunit CydD [Mergibacter septicus]|uniref:Thiol reductant ABC exporter subunit CydD n=1 Tax=Mergibacter septicus TaxID=221402 RepID=A0A8E3MFN2_9PAST|nr:cysteine/glutathione ABC transporter permease/ATP-binding protein CydD [Mergibacter septicus]AWX15111.1 thiol reductant ABC exporter subunit CydD [Mergibacter septicus]QDJ14364.1 thiol reductant ABC exporter subunit CydD [Mergibacter septicus]UTU48196.1 cysteine/glutathione ABC transporter permease/ATP-binding protein CydD [Mergibacter septicus]WMR96185.1 cysteine/glutathione ABC transporter permease/ATP-binding protein CydD [Mergibacter septicus]